MRTVGIILCLLTVSLSAWPAAQDKVKTQIQDEQREKSKIDQRIKQNKREIKKVEKQEQSVLSEIIRQNRRLNAANNDYKVSQHNLKIVRGKLDDLQAKVEESWVKVRSHQSKLASRLRTLNRQGTLEPLTLLLNSDSNGQFLARYRFLRTLAAKDRKVIEDTYLELEQISSFEVQYREQESELERRAEQVRKAKGKVADEKRSREKVLYAVRAEKKKKESLISDLQKSSVKLQGLIARLQQVYEKSRRQGDLAHHPDRAGGKLGTLQWPLRGRVVTSFGAHKHAKFNTTIFNRGIEISARLGSEIAASSDGTVLFADYFEGYGQMVVLDHGSGYFTVYGHAGALDVEAGQAVVKGQRLGEVGAAGVSENPTLYFEVRQNGKPLNPLRYLG